MKCEGGSESALRAAEGLEIGDGSGGEAEHAATIFPQNHTGLGHESSLAELLAQLKVI